MDELDEQKERLAAEAAQRIKDGHHWADWRAIAEGLEVGRRQAMRETHTNEPFGRGYVKAFGAWLDKRPWAREIDKATRAHLFWYVDHAGPVETWRETLAKNQREAWVHPTSIKRHFERMSAVKNPEKNEKLSPMAALKAENVKLQEDLDKAKKRADGGSLFDLRRDSVQDIAKVIVDELSNDKFKRLMKALTAAGKEKYSAHAG